MFFLLFPYNLLFNSCSDCKFFNPIVELSIPAGIVTDKVNEEIKTQPLIVRAI